MAEADSMEFYLEKFKRHSPIVALIDKAEGTEPDEREKFMATSITPMKVAGHVPNDLHSLKLYLSDINAKGRDENGVALGYLEAARDEVKEARRVWKDRAERVLKDKDAKPTGQWLDAINKGWARKELYALESRILIKEIERQEAQIKQKERERREKYESRYGKFIHKKLSGGKVVRVNGMKVENDIIVETGQPLAEFEQEIKKQQAEFKKKRNAKFQAEWNAYKGDKVFVPLEG